MSKGATKGGARCFFGEPHWWLMGWYDESGQWHGEGEVKCARCGRIEED